MIRHTLSKIIHGSSAAVVSLFSFSSVVLAQSVRPDPVNVSDPVGKKGAPFTDLGPLVGNVFSFVLIIASILLFLYLILGGVQWLTSGGDKMATQAARDRITAALTGLLIILAVWGVFKILEAAFGINIFGTIKFPGAIKSPYE